MQGLINYDSDDDSSQNYPPDLVWKYPKVSEYQSDEKNGTFIIYSHDDPQKEYHSKMFGEKNKLDIEKFRIADVVKVENDSLKVIFVSKNKKEAIIETIALSDDLDSGYRHVMLNEQHLNNEMSNVDEVSYIELPSLSSEPRFKLIQEVKFNKDGKYLAVIYKNSVSTNRGKICSKKWSRKCFAKIAIYSFDQGNYQIFDAVLPKLIGFDENNMLLFINTALANKNRYLQTYNIDSGSIDDFEYVHLGKGNTDKPSSSLRVDGKAASYPKLIGGNRLIALIDNGKPALIDIKTRKVISHYNYKKESLEEVYACNDNLITPLFAKRQQNISKSYFGISIDGSFNDEIVLLDNEDLIPDNENTYSTFSCDNNSFWIGYPLLEKSKDASFRKVKGLYEINLIDKNESTATVGTENLFESLSNKDQRTLSLITALFSKFSNKVKSILRPLSDIQFY